MKRLSRPLPGPGVAAICVVALFGAASLASAQTPAAAPPPAALAPASSAELDVLFAALGKSPGLLAKFREQKRIALLAAPLKSEGTVHFDRTHGLAKHGRTPSSKSVLLTSTSLSMWDGKKVENVSLATAPGLKAFADGFRMILAADRPGLEKSFEMHFFGDPNARWQLTLTPRDAGLKKAVSAIELAGTKIELSSLVVKEANGDVTTTEFFDLNTAKKYSEAEAKDIFRVPPKLP